jgi:hypothetical protein
MVEWSSLRDARGPAERVPVLLAAAAAAGPDEQDPWDDLWDRLCHQGTVYSASYAALPALTKMSRRGDPDGYVLALHLAADIIASTDGPEDRAMIRQRYRHELADLCLVAARNLRHAKDDTAFVYLLEALMAFEDGGVWQRNLHQLANGEAEFECPSCGEFLSLGLDGPPFQLESGTDASVAPTTVTPAEPSPATVEGRLLALARANDRPAVAAALPHLFGDATCPHCHTPFQVSQALS